MRYLAIMLALAAGGTAQARTRYDATIVRTTFGIPHITARTWQGIGYGVGYAYAQDNLCLIAEEFATVAGERSLHFGPKGSATLGFATIDNLASDVFFRTAMDLPKLRAGATAQGREAGLLAAGYVAGYNRYLRDIGGSGIPAECRGKAWVRPITMDDLLRLTEKQMLLASSLALAPAIANAAPPGKATAARDIRLPRMDELGIGSNGWAFGGDVTADGRGMVIGNPHFPWNGPSRFWQMHVTLPGRIDAMGAGIAGSPIPTLGFNRDIAWTHTVTAARHFTLYQLTLDPTDPTAYIVDGKPVAMTRREVRVPMPDGAAPVVRTAYATRFGPIVVAPTSGLTWTTRTAFALRDANAANQRGLGAWVRIARARTVADIRAAVSETLGIPWVNTIAADRAGNALHADVTAVPNVSADKIKACATPLSALASAQATLLDGSRSACDWDTVPGTPVPGLMPARDQMVLERRDYVTNSNDSYWMSNPRAPSPALSPILGAHRTALSLRTRSNFRETDAMIAGGKVDHARAEALVLANKSLAADMLLDSLLTLCAGKVEVVRGCSALKGWDRRFDVDSRGAALFAAWWTKARLIPGVLAVKFDPATPLTTPRDLATTGETAPKLIAALAAAMAELDAAGVPLDARWADVQAAPRGAAWIAIHGGPGAAGVLNVQESRPQGEHLVPYHGSSYIQVVGFDATSPVADALLSYSQSPDPASPHFADQTREYSVKRWHRLPFTPAQVRAEMTGTPLRIAE